LYDAIETGRIEIDDLSPRIKGLKARLAELEKKRSRPEAGMAHRGIVKLSLAEVQRYARDSRHVLVESDIRQEGISAHVRKANRNLRAVGDGAIQVADGTRSGRK
jgi:hypothetical protein